VVVYPLLLCASLKRYNLSALTDQSLDIEEVHELGQC
jgi:hypothetical protein